VLLAASFLMGLLGGCSDSKSSSPPPLTGPSNVAATAVSSGSADVSWDAISGVTDYKIYYSNTTPVNRTTAANLICSTNSCTVTGLDYLNNPYYIVVTAMYGTAESLPSQEERVDLPPMQPTSVTAMPGDTQVTLIWGSVEEATGYNIYRGTAPGVTKIAPPYMANVLSPHVDTNVINGTSYFYAVTSLGPGGESILSNEVGATPNLPPPGAPTYVSASLTPETTLSITLNWSAPSSGGPITSFNVYRSATSATATDFAKINPAPIPATTFTYVDASGLVGRTTYYYYLTAMGTSESVPSLVVNATPKGGGSGGGGGGGGDTAYGNNLSVPVIFADGFGLAGAQIVTGWTMTAPFEYNTGLRPNLTTDPTVTVLPYLDPASTWLLNNVTYYPQATASTWQAEWVKGSGAVVDVNVAFGDNLSSQTLRASSSIRIDIAVSTPTTTPMLAYTMKSLYGSRESEVQGTDGTTYLATTARVFAANGALKIEKLDGQSGNVVYTYIDKAVYEKFGVDGPVDGVAGELNVGGSIGFGYNWALNTATLPAGIDKAGWWRITFYLKDTYEFLTFTGLTNKVNITSTNATLVSPAEVMIEVSIAQ
jgi:hypothetical protein